MSIGLPAHRRPQAVSRAFARAAHVAGLVCLVAAAAMVGVVQAEHPELLLWPAALALLPMVLMLIALDRTRTLFYSISYVVIGGASIYAFAVVVMAQFVPLDSSDSFVLSLPRIAMLLVGGSGTAFLSGIIWSAIGLVAAEIAIVFAALQTGVRLAPDATSLTSFALVAGTLLLLQFGQRWVAAVQPSLHRAARDEELASVRYGIESRAAAMMHDTVLNHLAAIGNAGAGALSLQLQSQIERDLEVLVGEEWLSEPSSTVAVQARAEWQQGPLHAAIAQSRALGLDVDVSGDLSAAARVDPERAKAVALAVKQCLVNVLKHSGTRQAEVVLFGSESELSVMVIDGGKGFSEAENGADRLGLRQSVRRRMELAGGSVTVWSTPGRGTSVMIRVPATHVDTVVDVT